MSPKVSIITPAFNSERFIGECIDSVLNQEYRDFEYIIVEDGSTDRSKSIIIERSKADCRINCIFHDSNRGAGSARNTGLNAARGLYIAFLDADDYWDRLFLSRMTEVLDRSLNYTIGVFCWSNVINEDGSKIIDQLRPDGGAYNLERFILGICPPGNGSSLLVRKKCIERCGGFGLRPVCQDMELWLAMLARNSLNSFYCIPEFLTWYRKRTGSLTNSIKHHNHRRASLEYIIDMHLGAVSKDSRWKVLARFSEYAASFSPWMGSAPRRMACLALREGGMHALFSKKGILLVIASTLGTYNFQKLKSYPTTLRYIFKALNRKAFQAIQKISGRSLS